MKITIKTAEVVMGETVTPLTRAIVKQLPRFDIGRYTKDAQLSVVGEVSLVDENVVIIQTPDMGLARITSNNYMGLGLGTNNGSPLIPFRQIERIILLK